MIVPAHAVKVVEHHAARLTSRKVAGKPATDTAKAKFKYGVLNLVAQVYKEPLNLNTRFIDKAIGHPTNRALFSSISEELFNTKSYKVGSYAKEYSLKEKGEAVKVDVPEGLDTYIEGYRKAITSYWIKADPWCKLQHELMKEITIDAAEAWKSIKESYPKELIKQGLDLVPSGVDIEQAISWYETGNKAALKRIPSESRDAIQMHVKRQTAEKFLRLWAVAPDKRKLFVKRSTITWRIYTSFNSTPKLIRQHLKLNQEGLKRLDLVKSHPTILVSCIWSTIQKFKKGKIFLSGSTENFYFPLNSSKKSLFETVIAKAITKEAPSIPYYCASTFLEVGKIRQELNYYFRANASPDIEERKRLQRRLEFKAWELCSRQQDKDASPTRKRYTRENFLGEFKSAQMFWLNGDPNSPVYRNHFFVRAFYKEFPFISRIIELLKTKFALDTAQGARLKKEPFSALAIALQRVEAELMQDSFSGLDVLLVHDEIAYNSRVDEEQIEKAKKKLPEPLRLEFK